MDDRTSAPASPRKRFFFSTMIVSASYKVHQWAQNELLRHERMGSISWHPGWKLTSQEVLMIMQDCHILPQVGPEGAYVCNSTHRNVFSSDRAGQQRQTGGEGYRTSVVEWNGPQFKSPAHIFYQARPFLQDLHSTTWRTSTNGTEGQRLKSRRKIWIGDNRFNEYLFSEKRIKLNMKQLDQYLKTKKIISSVQLVSCHDMSWATSCQTTTTDICARRPLEVHTGHSERVWIMSSSHSFVLLSWNKWEIKVNINQQRLRSEDAGGHINSRSLETATGSGRRVRVPFAWDVYHMNKRLSSRELHLWGTLCYIT